LLGMVAPLLVLVFVVVYGVFRPFLPQPRNEW
jgi:hypothetical protein